MPPSNTKLRRWIVRHYGAMAPKNPVFMRKLFDVAVTGSAHQCMARVEDAKAFAKLEDHMPDVVRVIVNGTAVTVVNRLWEELVEALRAAQLVDPLMLCPTLNTPLPEKPEGLSERVWDSVVNGTPGRYVVFGDDTALRAAAAKIAQEHGREPAVVHRVQVLAEGDSLIFGSAETMKPFIYAQQFARLLNNIADDETTPRRIRAASLAAAGLGPSDYGEPIVVDSMHPEFSSLFRCWLDNKNQLRGLRAPQLMSEGISLYALLQFGDE